MVVITKTELTEVFARNNIVLNNEQCDKFIKYADMLVDWNTRINLTAITDSYGIILKHFLDSVLPFSTIKLKGVEKIIDVGTGAGFPGIPLKIMYPDIKLTLLDSLNKRVNFLNNVSQELGFVCEAIHFRAEEAGVMPDFRESFDIATARAVADLSVLCEYCLPFVKLNGHFISLKGSNGDVEAKKAQNAIKVLGGELILNKSYVLENGDGRTLIDIKKISHTSSKYPRNKGQMTKKPL